MANDSGPVDFSSLGGSPTSAVTSTAAAPPAQPDATSGPVNFSSLGGRPVNSDVSAAATAAQTIPPVTQSAVPGVHTPGTPWPQSQPWYVRAGNAVGETGADLARFGVKLGEGDSDAWSKFKSRMFEPVKQEEIERIPGLEPDRTFSLQEHGEDYLGHVFGKDRGDYIRENILNGFTPEVVARGAAKSLTDWYSPVMLAASIPGRIAHGYAVAAEAAQKLGQTEKATILLGKAKLAGVIGTVSGVPFVGSQVNSLIDNWQGMTPAERVAALSGILGGTMMTGVATHEAGGPKAVGQAVVDPIKQIIQERTAAKANKVSGEDMIAANRDFKKAIPPTKTNSYTDNDLAVVNNYLEPHHENVESIRSVEHVVDALDHSIEGIENKVSQHIKLIPNEPIATNVLDDVRNALEQNERGDEFVKAGMKEIEGLDLADMNMARADNVRRQLNMENQGILEKNKYKRASAEVSDPGFAAREAAAESLRNGIYNQLEAHRIEGTRELRQEEGSLLKVQKAAQAQLFNGDKVLKGTGGAGLARKVLAGSAQTASTIAGMGLGSMSGGGVPATMMGGAAGSIVGEAIKGSIMPPDLTHNETIERRFNNYKAATGQPGEITVPHGIQAPPAPEAPAGTQQEIPPPVPKATPGQPEQPSLFGTTTTEPSQQNPMVERQLLQQKIRPLQAILESPTATAAEKIEAARQIAKLGLGQFANPEIPESGVTQEEKAEAANTPLEPTKTLPEVRSDRQKAIAKIQRETGRGYQSASEYYDNEVAKNPTKATGESALGSKTTLETRQPDNAGEGYLHPDKLAEPAREIPADSRPKGSTSQSVHEHEFGGHLANIATEGFSADRIIGSEQPEAGRRTVAAVIVNWDGIERDPSGIGGRLSKESVKNNIHKIMSVTMGGAAQDELNGIPFKKNQALSSDLRFARQIAKEVGFTPEQTDGLIQAGLDRARKNLTQPGMQDTIKSNAAVRETNLEPGLIASPERTKGLVNEFRRIHEQNGNQVGQAHGETGEAVQGDASGTPAEGPRNGPEDVTGGEAKPQGQPFEVQRGLRERSTGDEKVDQAIKTAGAIPAGDMMNLALFHDPETGSTLALDKREVTPELVQKHLDESREKFGKMALATEKEAEPEIAEKAINESKKSGGGFVADMRTGKPTDTGFLVEVAPEKRLTLDHPATPKDLQKFYNDNRQLFKQHPELRIGGYQNELNISAHTDSQQTAEQLARKLDQKSVWDVKKGQEIPTGGQGKTTKFADYPFEKRIKELRGHE